MYFNTGPLKRQSTICMNILGDNDQVKTVEFSSAFFVAPQFYYTDYKRFGCKPRQIQTLLNAITFFPIPINLKFKPSEQYMSTFLRNCVKLNNVYVDVNKVECLLERAKTNLKQEQSKNFHYQNSLYNDENKINAFEAIQIFDAKLNKRSQSRIGHSKSQLHATLSTSQQNDSVHLI